MTHPTSMAGRKGHRAHRALCGRLSGWGYSGQVGKAATILDDLELTPGGERVEAGKRTTRGWWLRSDLKPSSYALH